MNSKGKLEGREHDDTVMSLAIAYHCLDSSLSTASVSIIGEDGVDAKQDAVYEANKNEDKSNGIDSGSPDINLGIV